MIKLIEALHDPSDLQKMWQLREILINPTHIMKCSDVSLEWKEKFRFNEANNDLISKLLNNSVYEFTRIIQTNGTSSVVVASIDQINEKINKMSLDKKLLKG